MSKRTRKDGTEGAGNQDQFIVSRQEAAKLLGVSDRSILNWHDREGLPVLERGKGRAGWKIDGRALVAWYVRRELDRQTGGEGEIKTLDREQLRLTSERADALAIANEIERGSLIRAEHVRDVCMEVAATVAATMKGWPGRCAADFANARTPAEARKLLDVEVRRASESMSASLGQLAQSVADRGNDGGAVSDASGTDG